MESAGIWIALIAAVIVWALIREKKKYKERQQESTNWNSSSETWPPRKEKTLVDDSWRSEPATDKQLDYIESLGGRVPARGLTKGEASDRITKLQPIDPDDAAVLRYFGLSTQEQTRDSVARVAEALLNDEAHKKAWGERPPSQVLKEFFRFAKMKMPSGIGYDAAEALIAQTLSQWKEAGDVVKVNDWMNYSRLLGELYDREARESLCIKKPPITLVRKCVAEFLENGSTYEAMADDSSELVERMIELKPDLESLE